MHGNRLSIPFTLPEIYHGLAEGHGRLHVGEEGLRLEYRVKDAVFGLLKSEVREMFIPWAEIWEFEFKDGWVRRRFIIHAHSLDLVSDFPGADEGRIELRFKKVSRTHLREIHSHIMLRRSEHRLSEIDASTWPDNL